MDQQSHDTLASDEEGGGGVHALLSTPGATSHDAYGGDDVDVYGDDDDVYGGDDAIGGDDAGTTVLQPPQTLLQQLIAATETERRCPDIMPYPAALIDGMVAQLAQAQARVTRMTRDEAQGAAALATNMHGAAAAAAASPSLLPFRPSDICQLNMQRAQFFLCELLRCRLRKIEALCASIYYEGQQQQQQQQHDNDADAASRAHVPLPQRAHLSANECIVADRLAAASHRAVLQAGLQSAPSELQHLTPHTPHAEGSEMLPRPNVLAYVFSLALTDLGQVQLSEGAERVVQAGEMFLLPYRTLRPHVLAGQVRLL